MSRRPLPPRAHSTTIWARRRADPGWLLLPLRGFLGVTFVYAGLQKLANPSFFDASSPVSIVGQMRSLQHSSPIGPLLAVSAHIPVLVGLLIALGELAVGVGALLGLYTRVAAAGGALLALTFFLTVSWSTTPYYYGADIVFLFAWLTLLGFGDRGVLSVQGWLRDRARAGLGLRPEPATVAVSTERLHALCPRGTACDLGRDGVCRRARGCPVFPLTEHLSPSTRAEIDRRTVVQTGTAAAAVAGGVALLAGLTAGIGRLAGGTSHQPGLAALSGPASPATSAAGAAASSSAAPPLSSSAAAASSSAAPPASSVPSSADPSTAHSTTRSPDPSSTSKRPAPPRTSAAPAGTAIGAATAVPLGQARSFTDPATGDPAWVVHPSGSRFVAFDAVCTHAGCTVNYDPSGVQFVCPCHGGVYDARTGQVLQGPPPAPLRRIPVQVVGGELRVDA